MDDYQRCGNELTALQIWLRHHGDPRHDGLVVKELANLLTSVNQVVLSSYAKNKQLAQDIRQDANQALMASANRFTATAISAAM